MLSSLVKVILLFHSTWDSAIPGDSVHSLKFSTIQGVQVSSRQESFDQGLHTWIFHTPNSRRWFSKMEMVFLSFPEEAPSEPILHHFTKTADLSTQEQNPSMIPNPLFSDRKGVWFFHLATGKKFPTLCTGFNLLQGT